MSYVQIIIDCDDVTYPDVDITVKMPMPTMGGDRQDIILSAIAEAARRARLALDISVVGDDVT